MILFVGNECTRTIGTIMSRIPVAKHHNTDVERSISGNNLLKIFLRNSITLKTENLYGFVSVKCRHLKNGMCKMLYFRGSLKKIVEKESQQKRNSLHGIKAYSSSKMKEMVKK